MQASIILCWTSLYVKLYIYETPIVTMMFVSSNMSNISMSVKETNTRQTNYPQRYASPCIADATLLLAEVTNNKSL